MCVAGGISVQQGKKKGIEETGGLQVQKKHQGKKRIGKGTGYPGKFHEGESRGHGGSKVEEKG